MPRYRELPRRKSRIVRTSHVFPNMSPLPPPASMPAVEVFCTYARSDERLWAKARYETPATERFQVLFKRGTNARSGPAMCGPKRSARTLTYGPEPGVKVYTHLSDQYGPYHSTTISATASEAPYLVDGLLYHETDLEIAEHYSDTGAFTDQIFGICQLLGFRLCTPHPRPRRQTPSPVREGFQLSDARAADRRPHQRRPDREPVG
jgi:hypothetical protein